MNTDRLAERCRSHVARRMAADPAHDLAHVERVVANTTKLTLAEGGNLEVTLPSAWLHDCVAVPKDSPMRREASTLSAREATDFLAANGYPEALLPEVFHAIEAHSFSAAIEARTLEAKIVQDADRLDALGAIGIARCFVTGGILGTPLYEPDDPFAESRTADDGRYTLDHFYCKLLGLAETMNTQAGRAEAARRTDFMRAYLEQLATETRGPRR